MTATSTATTPDVAGVGGCAVRAVVPTQLTIYFDESCELCQRCRMWMLGQPSLVPLKFVAAQDARAAGTLPSFIPLAEQLVVSDQAGNLWVGDAAFVMCFWSLTKWRKLSNRLSKGPLKAAGAAMFHLVSANRGRINEVLGCDAETCGHPK